jgi:F-type H+-transporting ATPase subunit gamma
MATLRTIKKRIKSAGSIQQITKAMKMVSAAKLRKSQERILAARR